MITTAESPVGEMSSENKLPRANLTHVLLVARSCDMDARLEGDRSLILVFHAPRPSMSWS